MHPLRCPYRGNASALWASTGVHNNIIRFLMATKSNLVALFKLAAISDMAAIPNMIAVYILDAKSKMVIMSDMATKSKIL